MFNINILEDTTNQKTSFLEWLKSLDTQFIVTYAILFVLLVLVIIVLFKSSRTLNLLIKKSIKIKEEAQANNLDFDIVLRVSNTSSQPITIKEIGVISKKIVKPLASEQIELYSRNFEDFTFPLEKIKEFVVVDGKKIKRYYFYVLDSVGRKSHKKAKYSRQLLIKEAKQLKKERNLENKIKRSESGNYNFIERVGKIFKIIFRPFYLLGRKIAESTNASIKNNEVKKQIKDLKHKKALLDKQELQRVERDNKLAQAQELYKITDPVETKIIDEESVDSVQEVKEIVDEKEVEVTDEINSDENVVESETEESKEE
jgi:hypothetical protein